MSAAESAPAERFEGVAVVKKANVYFDGRCVSHTVLLADGSRKSIGVIMPGAPLHFGTQQPEVMELLAGTCRVRLDGAGDGDDERRYGAGERFAVAGDSGFTIAVDEPLHYVCHFG